MSRITKILEAKIKIQIECDCGNKFIWVEGGNQKCPLCNTKYELVMGPRKKQGDKAEDMSLSEQIRQPVQSRQPFARKVM